MKIKQVEHIEVKESDDFKDEVIFKVIEMQRKGLDVEIQYQLGTLHHYALIIGREINDTLHLLDKKED